MQNKIFPNMGWRGEAFTRDALTAYCAANPREAAKALMKAVAVLEPVQKIIEALELAESMPGFSYEYVQHEPREIKRTPLQVDACLVRDLRTVVEKAAND